MVAAYGVRRTDVEGYEGMPGRSIFVVDRAGVIRWTWARSDSQPLPDLAEVLAQATLAAAESP